MSKIIAKSLSVAVLLAAAVSSQVSVAATSTANLGVSASVTDNCTISTSPVAFGSYDPITTHAASPLNSTGTVTITCTNGAAAAITLGQGANADTGSSNDLPLRRMTDGSSFLSYALYQDGGFNNVWGNDITTDVETTGTGSAQNFTVHGQVAPGQTSVMEGSYADTVVATVTF